MLFPNKAVVAATILVNDVGIEDTCRVGQLNSEAMDLELHTWEPEHGGSEDSDSDSDGNGNGKSDIVVLEGGPTAVVVKLHVAGSILVLVLQGILGVDMLEFSGTKCDIVCKHTEVANVKFIELVTILFPFENPLDVTLFVSDSGSGANVNDGTIRDVVLEGHMGIPLITYSCVEW